MSRRGFFSLATPERCRRDREVAPLCVGVDLGSGPSLTAEAIWDAGAIARAREHVRTCRGCVIARELLLLCPVGEQLWDDANPQITWR